MDVTGLQHTGKTQALVATVRIFDSVYESVENLGDISKVVKNLFESPDSSTLKIDMAEMQKKSPNSNNCDLFAVAVAMAILLLVRSFLKKTG